MRNVSRDNWENHWTDFSLAAEISPSMAWRRRVIDELLDIQRPGDGTRLLEIGCGPGSFAKRFHTRYPRARYLGLDSSGTAIQLASASVPTADFEVRDLLTPGATDGRSEFGATHAVCSEVLEHVDDPVQLMRNSLEYMAPGCKVIVTVPGGPRSAFQRHIGHRKHFKAEELRDILSSAGLRVHRATGAGFPFYNVYLGLLVLRGEKAIEQVAGEPGLTVRAAGVVFDFLFHFNSLRAGWQILAVAEL